MSLFSRGNAGGFGARRALVIAALLASVGGCEGGEMSGPDRPERLFDQNDSLDGGGSDPLDGGGHTADDAQVSCSPTLASIQSALFQPQCAMAGCHVGKSAAAALDLTRSDVSMLLVSVSASSCSGQTLIVPGNPDASFLVSKMSGHVPTGCGDPMPPGAATMVAPNLLECVRGYIRGLPVPDAGAGAACGSGLSLCSGACVDLQTDPKHCGTCAGTCGANASCSAGQCKCSAGLTSCNGSCVDTTTDLNHCQGCNVKCGLNQLCTPNGCASGGCGSLTQCGSACVDTSTSLSNCGGCGKVCPSGTSCFAGACTCPAGKTLCGGSCVDTQSDPNHCGGCGKVCGAGKACVQGSCSCSGGPVSFSQVSQILVDNCTNAGCHAGMVPKEGLNLSAGKAYAELVNVKASQCNDGRMLVPSSGSGPSYLLQKLSGQGICGGTQMPKAGTSLAASELTLIQNWVCNGAPP